MMASETSSLQNIAKNIEHQRVVDRGNELNMTKMTWAMFRSLTTRLTTASSKRHMSQSPSHLNSRHVT